MIHYLNYLKSWGEMKQMLLIFAIIFFSLIGVALVGRKIVKAKFPKDYSRNNFFARVRSTWAMCILVFLAFLIGKPLLLVLFAIISFLALREFVSITPVRQADYYTMVLTFYVLIPLQYFLILVDWEVLYFILIPVYGFLILPIISSTKDDVTNFFERAAKFQWANMLCVYCLSYTLALAFLPIKKTGFSSNNLMLYFLVVVQLSDSMQYVFGKMFGKHKIAPAISPKKTVEGTIYGSLFAVTVGTLIYWLTPFNIVQSFFMSLLIVVSSFFGGMVMSACKRSMKIKDWGNLIDGHGGVLDRVDGLCFAAPLFYHVVRYYFG